MKRRPDPRMQPSLFDEPAPPKRDTRFDVAPDMLGWSDRAIFTYQLLRDQDSLKHAEDFMIEFYKERIESAIRHLKELESGNQTQDSKTGSHQAGELPV